MSEQERKDLTWVIWRVWERDGEEHALRLLRLVGLVYGEREEAEMAAAACNYRDEQAAWK